MFGAGEGRERVARIPGEGGPRITVEVLNGTRVDGLARRTTWALRERGVDVVFYGTASDSALPATRVIARSGDSTLARRVRETLGFGEVEDRPDPDLLLDVTVILGLDAVGH